jgi:hypothetical protein
MRDLESILYDDDVPIKDVAELLEKNSPDEEYLVRIIRRYLMDDSLRGLMHSSKMSITDVLNGRTREHQAEARNQVFARWNEILGVEHFGKY